MREIWYVFDKTGLGAGAVIIDPQPVRQGVAMGAGDLQAPLAKRTGEERRREASSRVRAELLSGPSTLRGKGRLIVLKPLTARLLDGLPPAA